MNPALRLTAVYLLLLAPAHAQDGERIARLETEMRGVSAEVQRLERSLDRRFNDIEKKFDEAGHTIFDQWPAGLLGMLIVLDKAGYYLKRKNGNGAHRKEL